MDSNEVGWPYPVRLLDTQTSRAWTTFENSRSARSQSWKRKGVLRCSIPEPSCLTWRRSLSLDRTGKAGDVVFDEERVYERHWNRPEQCSGHKLAPIKHIATD